MDRPPMRGPVHETHINPGAAEGSRTPNLLITNQALCQLSYSGPLGRLYYGGKAVDPPQGLNTSLPAQPARPLVLRGGIAPLQHSSRHAVGVAGWSPIPILPD